MLLGSTPRAAATVRGWCNRQHTGLCPRRHRFDSVAPDQHRREIALKIELFVRGGRKEEGEPGHKVVVQTTIEAGDSVTPGSQFAQEFSVADLRGLPFTTTEDEKPKRENKSKTNTRDK